MPNVILIATGGIRASRQIDLAERLSRQGHKVRCINTSRSLIFLLVFFLKKPFKLAGFLRLKHSALFEVFAYFAEFTGKVSHIKSARWADIIVVAPATCNTIGKIVSGVTDSYPLLVIRAFERDRKVMIAPSMNPEMWADPFMASNIAKLKQTRKYVVIDTVLGTAASGDKGYGIMASNDTIISEINSCLEASSRAA